MERMTGHRILLSALVLALVWFTSSSSAGPVASGFPIANQDTFDVDINSVTALNVVANDTPLGTDTPLTVQATGTLGGSIANGSIIGGEGTGNLVFESNGVIGTSKPAYRVQSGAFLYSSACSAASGDDSCTEIVVNVDYIADLPSLAVANATVSTNEDQSVALGTITAAITDPDGAETLSLNIDNLPAGASLSDGVNISGTASTVITTIFKALQAFYQNGISFFCSDISYYSAHKLKLFFSVKKKCGLKPYHYFIDSKMLKKVVSLRVYFCWKGKFVFCSAKVVPRGGEFVGVLLFFCFIQ